MQCWTRVCMGSRCYSNLSTCALKNLRDAVPYADWRFVRWLGCTSRGLRSRSRATHSETTLRKRDWRHSCPTAPLPPPFSAPEPFAVLIPGESWRTRASLTQLARAIPHLQGPTTHPPQKPNLSIASEHSSITILTMSESQSHF